jgi:putative ABC transport system permease protein
MLRNYFVIAFRNFGRNRIFSLIHVLGLSIGLSASVVIFLITKYEFSFDHFEPGRDRLYRIVLDRQFNGQSGHSAAVPAPLAPAVQNEVTGVENVVPVMQFEGDAAIDVSIPYGNGQTPASFTRQPEIIWTNEDYFDIIPFAWIAGSASSMKAPFSTVLTESRARQYFPDIPLNSIMGKEIMYGKNLHTYVTGIVKDLDEHTDFTAVEFISYATIAQTDYQQDWMMDDWYGWTDYSKAYVRLSPANDHESAERQITDLITKYHSEINRDPKNTLTARLQPLEDIHFNIDYQGFGQRTAHKSTLYGLLAIAGFLLLLGSVNFINLSTAQASRRAREIGVRKTVGSYRKQIVMQFLIETLCMTTIAIIVSIIITPFLFRVFADYIPARLVFDLLTDWATFAFLLALTLLVSALSGFYPAIVLSAIRPALILRNRIAEGGGTRTIRLRKVLIVSQFMIAQFFVVAAFVVSRQIGFSIHQDLGYRKDAIINFELPPDTVADHRDMLVNQINAIAGVDMVSTGFVAPAVSRAAFHKIFYRNNEREVDIPVQVRSGDANYIRLYNIQVVAGRNVTDGKDVNEAVINEAYAKALGFEDPARVVGEELVTPSGATIPVVGVMKDFYQSSTRTAIAPLVFKAGTGDFFHVALHSKQKGSGQWKSTIEQIDNEFHKIYPGRSIQFQLLRRQYCQLLQRRAAYSQNAELGHGPFHTDQLYGFAGIGYVHLRITKKRDRHPENTGCFRIHHCFYPVARVCSTGHYRLCALDTRCMVRGKQMAGIISV